MVLDRVSFLGHRGNVFGFGHVEMLRMRKTSFSQKVQNADVKLLSYLGVGRRVPTSVDRPRYFPFRREKVGLALLGSAWCDRVEKNNIIELKGNLCPIAF